MRSIGTLLLSGHVADSVARLLPNNPLLRGGAATLAARWAMRSIPAALALAAAGAAYRHFAASKKSSPRAGQRKSGPRPAAARRASPKAASAAT